MMFMLTGSLRILCVVAALTMTILAEGVAPFVHPGLLNNLDELRFFKQKVAAGAEPWASAYKQRVAAGDYAALDFTPNATNCRQMVTETEALKENPCVNRMALDMQAAYSHALQWFIEQDRNQPRGEQHARKAIQILNHWFGSDGIKSWTGSRKRYAGYLTASGVYAAEIMRHTYRGWSEAEIKQIETTLNVIWNFIKDGHPRTMNAHFSNQESSAVMGKMAIAIFLSDRQKFDDALAHYRRHLANNIYYRHPTQPDFKNYETCRDLGHTQLSLSNLTASAEMAWKQGVDLYSLRDHSLLKSIEFQLRFILDEPDQPDAKCANDPNPNTQGRVEVRDPKAFYEAAYHHYHDRLKLDADRLRRVIFGSYRGQAFRPENNPNISSTKGTGVGFGWGTLTHAGLPAYPAGHRPQDRAVALPARR